MNLCLNWKMSSLGTDAGAIVINIKTIFSPKKLTKAVIRLLERTNTKDRYTLFVDHNELLQAKLAYPQLTVRALLRGRLAHYADYLQELEQIVPAFPMVCSVQ